ncbi:MAG: hypothetical protein R2838_25860 [Caldilineaceae bacterium]
MNADRPAAAHAVTLLLYTVLSLPLSWPLPGAARYPRPACPSGLDES